MRFFDKVFVLNVGIEGARQGASKARQMGTAIALRDVIGVTKNLFLKCIIPLHGHFYPNAVLSLGAEMENLVKLLLVLV